MGLKEIWERIKGLNEDNQNSGEELRDDQTRDKYLRSLRREDRLYDEKEEKEYLIKKLAERKRELLKKHMFGIKDESERSSIIKKVGQNKRNILKEKKSLLGNNYSNKKKYKNNGFCSNSFMR